MKRILFILFALLPLAAQAQLEPCIASGSTTNTTYTCSSKGTGDFNIQTIGAGAINFLTTSSNRLTIAATGALTSGGAVTATTGNITATAGDLVAGGGDVEFTANTDIFDSSGTNVGQVQVCVESTCDQTTGSVVAIHGIADATVGQQGTLELLSGNVNDADADIRLTTGHAAGDVEISNPTGIEWFIDSTDGDIEGGPQGGNILLAAGKGIYLQEATAGSKCMGTLTANGATPVVTATTCAKTGARIFLSRTSSETGAVNVWVSAITDATSFAVTGEAADTGTYDWIIFNETP